MESGNNDNRTCGGKRRRQYEFSIASRILYSPKQVSDEAKNHFGFLFDFIFLSVFDSVITLCFAVLFAALRWVVIHHQLQKQNFTPLQLMVLTQPLSSVFLGMFPRRGI